MDNQLEKFIRDNASAFDTRTPNPDVLARIQQQMQGGAARKEKAILVPMRIVRVAAACLIILAGAALFWINREPNNIATTAQTATIETPGKAPETIVPKTETADRPIAVQQDAVPDAPERKATLPAEHTADGNRQLIFAGLRDMEAPSQRMIAASEAVKLGNIDHDIINALAKTLNTDPNTNVRLAALEALGKFQRETYVKKKLIESLQKQNDPMVQIALIDILTTLRERKILQQLDKMVNDAKTMEAVKDHAYASIFTLRS